MLFRFRAQGMASDQAASSFSVTRRCLLLAYLESTDLVARLWEATNRAEAAAKQLWGACRTLATFIVKPDADAPDARQPAREDLEPADPVMGRQRHGPGRRWNCPSGNCSWPCPTTPPW